jgi:hypothetical protein
MRHKPMLFNKIINNSCGKGREVIGLIGTHHGCGVTYTGLMLAFYMGEELGKRTAFLECNDHDDMRLIQDAYDWTEEDSFFSFHQITCYSRVKPKCISEIFGEGYECLILDFGTDFTESKEEFLRCSTKIVVGGRSEWDIPKLVSFTEDSEVIRGSDSWLYFIPQSNEKTAERISKEIKRKVWMVPYVEEPTLTSRISNRFFGKHFHS